MLRVKDWNRLFEKNRTRELKAMKWVPVPTKQDGDGYTELMDCPDGLAHLGAWVAILQVAAKAEPRGSLLRQGGRPHDIDSLARITRGRAEVFEAAIPRLLQIGWLEQIPQDGAATSQDGAATSQDGAGWGGYRGGQDRTEEKLPTVVSCPEPPAAAGPDEAFSEWEFPIVGKDTDAWLLPQAKLDEYRETYPDLDIDGELRKARQWLRDNPQNRKTARGMTKFLGGWLSRSQNRGGRPRPVGYDDEEVII